MVGMGRPVFAPSSHVSRPAIATAGQWVGDGSENQPILVNRRPPRDGGQVLILGRRQPVTPMQEVRLAISIGRMREALRAVQRT